MRFILLHQSHISSHARNFVLEVPELRARPVDNLYGMLWYLRPMNPTSSGSRIVAAAVGQQQLERWQCRKQITKGIEPLTNLVKHA
jgi:hypothetical protein